MYTLQLVMLWVGGLGCCLTGDWWLLRYGSRTSTDSDQPVRSWLPLLGLSLVALCVAAVALMTALSPRRDAGTPRSRPQGSGIAGALYVCGAPIVGAVLALAASPASDHRGLMVAATALIAGVGLIGVWIAR